MTGEIKGQGNLANACNICANMWRQTAMFWQRLQLPLEIKY